jgi:ATP-binding cassette, subfamily B, multidrug efflux pump
VIGISRDIEFDLRNDLFAHLETLSYSYYQRMRTGDIMARVTNDLNAVRMLMGPAIMYSANTLVFTAAALWFMVHNSPKLTLYAFLPLPIVSVTIQYFGRRIHERFERIQAMFSDISARAQENFSGARVIRAYVQEEAEIASFETANQEYVARSLKLVRLMGMLWPTLEFMLGLASGAGAVDRRPRSVGRAHANRRVHRIQHLHDATHVPHHRSGMGGQHFPAGHGFAGAAE